jgi:MBG domain (YGX type)/FecR protein
LEEAIYVTLVIGSGVAIMGRARRSFGVLSGACFLFAWIASGGAVPVPIGKAESVVPATTYVRGGAASELVINAGVEQDDVIRTTRDGSTQVRFLDDTMLTVGPNAEIRLDKGIFDGSQARTLSITLVTGAMRFVSGLSDRKSYEIKTPIANIGLRGTVVDVEQEGGRTIINFVDGSGPICIVATGACRSIASGEPPLAIGPNGFSPATPAEAARLWHRLDKAHLALARQAGRDPSAATGAAKGFSAPFTPAAGSGQSSGDTTGSINSGSSTNTGSGNSGSTNIGSSNTNVGGALPYIPPPPIIQSVLPSVGSLANSITDPASLTYTATAASRTYGAANPTFTGTVTGLQNGDVLANVTSGTASFTTTATAASGVGQYPINGSGLTMTSANYNTGILQASGNATALTIVAATLTYTANPATRTYGAANPTFTGTVTGLQNGDALANVTSGTASFTTTATAASGVGQYPINGSGLTVTSGNYTGVLQALGNPTALTIVAATLTYTANPVSIASGAAIPTLTGTVTGLQNSDTLGTVTSGTLAFSTTATSASPAASYAINGSGLTVTSPNYDLTILQAPSNATALTITTPAGPGFPFSVFRVNGRGNLPVQLDSQIGNKSGFFYAPASSLTYASGTNDIASVVISRTPDLANEPNPVTLTRGTAQAQTIIGPSVVLPGFGSAPVPTYFLSSWSNGTFDYSQPGNTPSTLTLGPYQAFETIGWGYTGDLFTGPVSFGGTVLFNLENVLKPVWSNGQSAPGAFTSGEVAVAIGTTTLRYGMIGTVVMSEGTFNMQTPGGITNPTQSGAVGLLSGQLDRIQANGGTVSYTQTGPTNACPNTCSANMDFNIIAPGKVAVTYALGNGANFDNGNNSVEITGIATFAQSTTGSLLPSAGFVSFIDNFGSSQVVSTGSASGTLQVTNNVPSLQSVTMDAGPIRTLGTATSVDNGTVPGILSWERWTNGTFSTGSGPAISIPLNSGLAFVDGQLATNLPVNNPVSAPSPGLSVQYSLVGGTSPTVASGAVTPGTLGAGSKIGIDFVDQKVGVDLLVGIGGGAYEIATAGGASTPSTSTISLSGLNGAQFSATNIPVSITTPSSSIACTVAGSCAASITGFLAGDGTASQNNGGGGQSNGAPPPNVGINYSFGNPGGPLSGQVSGAAAFGRDIPVGNVVGYAFSANNYSLPAGTPTMALGGGPAVVIGDSNTASGLSIGFINVQQGNGSNYQDFERGAFGPPNPSSAVAVDQGAVSGILSWERWTNGTVNDQTSTNYTLTSNQGIHVLNGVLATNVPTTNVTYLYNFVGATSPTIADGSVAPGSMQKNSQVGITFGSSPLFGVNLNVNINSSNFNIQSPGSASSPSLPAIGLAANPIFSNSSIPTTLTSGSGLTGCTTTCNASINGFLAGNGATHLGILYQFNTANAAKMVSGAAAFAR